MAATKKSTTKKKTGSGAPQTKKTAQSAGAKSAKSKYQAELLEKEQRRRQFWALMLFALGLINVGITYIKGENLWQSLHNIQFGLISWCAYAVAPAMLAVAVLLSMGKIRSAPVTRVAQVTVLLLLLCAAAQLFSQDPLPGEKFAEVISNVYQNGLELQGGGVFSLIFAAPLMWLGQTPARVTVIVLLFVMVMLVTGLTIADLMRTAYKPVKKLEESYAGRIGERAEVQSVHTAAAFAPGKKFEYDIDIDDDLPAGPGRERQPAARPSKEPAISIGSAAVETGRAQAAVRQSKTTEQRRREEDDRPPFDPDTVGGRSVSGVQSARDRLLNASGEDAPGAWTSSPEPVFEPQEIRTQTEPVRQRPVTSDGLYMPNKVGAEDIPPVRTCDAPEEPEDDEAARSAAELDELVSRAVISDSRAYGGDGRFRVRAEGEQQAHTLPAEKKADEESVPDEPEPDDTADGQDVEDAEAEEMQELEEAKKKAVPEYVYPPIELLPEQEHPRDEDVSEELKNNAANLVDTLNSFGVQTRIINISRGPTVTRYELQPSAGVKISRITGLADDIALNLAAAGVRIEAPIPNKAAVGIEVPNKVRSGVSLREIIDSDTFRNAQSKLTAAVGLDITGRVVTADLAKMPHLLIAGSTGSGKSVCMNSFIVSLIYKASPEEVRLIMIDPKVVEFNKYNGLPHLLIPVVTDPRKAAGALGWAVSEMMNRYKLFADNGVNDIRSYNRLAEETPGMARIPQVVIIIDELSDLMMAAPNEVEDYICRLAQMARAAGMHLVIATQRPSVNVITGVIKANIPSRIALMLSSYVDSRTILDAGGAEKLLGNGDMLFHPAGSPKPTRIQGCFVSDEDVKKIVKFVSSRQEAEYDDEVLDEIEHSAVVEKGAKNAKNSNEGGGFEDEDPMLPAAIECVIEMGQASTSMLQRKLKLGYSRAGRLMDEMEQRGIVGPFEGSKSRAVLITRQQWLEMKSNMG